MKARKIAQYGPNKGKYMMKSTKLDKLLKSISVLSEMLFLIITSEKYNNLVDINGAS